MQENQSFPYALAIAEEFSFSISCVQTVIQLLENGNTIPFIARYRKEATGNLDEVQLKNILERYTYLKDLENRKQTILASIAGQGKLTEELHKQIVNCQIKTLLEDLYLPYKPKRRTRAMIAKEKGLEPLANFILEQSLNENLEEVALSFSNLEKGVENIAAALSVARDIVAEKIAENAAVRALVREAFASDGMIISKVRPEKASIPTKFEQYYDFKEPVRTIPSHRYLAIRRGEKEEILNFSIEVKPETLLQQIEKLSGWNPTSPFNLSLSQAIEDAFHRLLCPSVETDVRLDLKWASDRSAVAVFADNLRHLLLTSPLGGRPVLGIDPGIRTGCKCAMIDNTGKYLQSTTIFLSQGNQLLQQAKEEINKLVKQYQPHAIAIGNGTAGRETETFIRTFLKEISCDSILVVLVNEAGASVYSASDVAREEFPDLDLTIRGAISIARRLQDPLAELVKIDPKSIGVGQYQHDVHQPLLQNELQHVVESCVNYVGVDLNTASASLLSCVSGIGPTLACKIVKHRETKGAFQSRKTLREISGFGLKTFEQSAGFLRIRGGENPLDSSAVHPERYELIEQMANDLDVSLVQLLSQPQLAEAIDKTYYAHLAGEHTIADIIQELKKPGRDPRACFEPPSFRDDILSIDDLKIGMRLEGVITNVTAFGAFVDIGVHQDGLIHLSELSDKFIKHPSEIAKAGEKITVKVMQIDVPRRRISLTARLGQNRQINLSSISSEKREKAKIKPTKQDFFSRPFSSL